MFDLSRENLSDSIMYLKYIYSGSMDFKENYFYFVTEDVSEVYFLCNIISEEVGIILTIEPVAPIRVKVSVRGMFFIRLVNYMKNKINWEKLATVPGLYWREDYENFEKLEENEFLQWLFEVTEEGGEDDIGIE